MILLTSFISIEKRNNFVEDSFQFEPFFVKKTPFDLELELLNKNAIRFIPR
jgi:hypothetical protein